MLRWLSVLIIFTTFLSYLSPYVSPEQFWLLSLFGLGFPFLLIANILLFLFWLFKKDRYCLYFTGTLLLGMTPIKSIIGWNQSSVSQNPESLRLMTYNTAYFAGKHNAPPKIKAQFFKEFQLESTIWEDLDIVCFQEIGQKNAEKIAANNGFKYTGTHRLKTTVSKYPILKSEKVINDWVENFALFTDIQLPNQIIRVYNIHLKSNRISDTTNKISKEGNLREKETWQDIKSILKRYIKQAKIRAQQAELLAHHIQQSPYPVIVCGDFNETPMSYAYRILTESLQDGFVEKGQGLGSSYLGKIPFLKIDYILVSPDFSFDQYRQANWKFSDHKAVKTELRLTR